MKKKSQPDDKIVNFSFNIKNINTKQTLLQEVTYHV